MLEEFKKIEHKLMQHLIDIGADCTRISAEKVWKECCLWVLQKAGENINLIDFMQEIAIEAGVNGIVTGNGDGTKFTGGIADVTKLNLLRDDECNGKCKSTFGCAKKNCPNGAHKKNNGIGNGCDM